jgi:hypothetical protein
MRSNKQITTNEMWRDFVTAAAVLAVVTIGTMIVMAMR